MTTSSLPIQRSLALAVGASLAAAALVALPLGAPPTDPTRVLDWWEHTGTPSSAIALTRIVAVSIAAYVAAIAGVITLSALARLPRLARAAARGLPAGLHRSVAGATIAVASLTPTFAAAAEADPAPIVLFDIGTAEVELIPAEAPIAPAVPGLPRTDALTEVAEVADTWTVQQGDHLWSIAEDTLADFGDDAAPSERDVARYWQRIINENRAAIGADPDVIHPGTTLVLPQL